MRTQQRQRRQREKPKRSKTELGGRKKRTKSPRLLPPSKYYELHILSLQMKKGNSLFHPKEGLARLSVHEGNFPGMLISFFPPAAHRYQISSNCCPYLQVALLVNSSFHPRGGQLLEVVLLVNSSFHPRGGQLLEVVLLVNSSFHPKGGQLVSHP